MASSRLKQVCKAIGQTCTSACNDAGVTTLGQTYMGYPNFEDLTKILQQFGAAITIYPPERGAVNATRWFLKWMVAQQPEVLLTGSISGTQLTFGGTATPGVNVHTLFGSPLVDTLYTTVAGDTPATVAAAVAASINSKSVPGVNATVNGFVVTLTGTPYLKCNLGGTGILAYEGRRVRRTIQVSVWSPEEAIRDSIFGALESGIGTDDNLFLPLGDGTTTYCRWESEHLSDERVKDYQMYIAHILLCVEYGVLRTWRATQIGAITETYSLNGGPNVTITEG